MALGPAGTTAAVFLTTDRRAGLYAGAERLAVVPGVPPAGARVGDAEGAGRAAQTVRVRLTTAAALRGEGLPEGTDLGPAAAAAG